MKLKRTSLYKVEVVEQSQMIRDGQPEVASYLGVSLIKSDCRLMLKVGSPTWPTSSRSRSEIERYIRFIPNVVSFAMYVMFSTSGRSQNFSQHLSRPQAPQASRWTSRQGFRAAIYIMGLGWKESRLENHWTSHCALWAWFFLAKLV